MKAGQHLTVILGIGTLAMLGCRKEAPPPPPPVVHTTPLTPWSWHPLGGILVIEGEVDRPTELILRGPTLNERRSVEFGPVRWELLRPGPGEVVELRTAEGALLAKWNLDGPPPEPTPAPQPETPKAQEPPPAPMPQVQPQPEPPRPQAPDPTPTPDRRPPLKPEPRQPLAAPAPAEPSSRPIPRSSTAPPAAPSTVPAPSRPGEMLRPGAPPTATARPSAQPLASEPLAPSPATRPIPRPEPKSQPSAPPPPMARPLARSESLPLSPRSETHETAPKPRPEVLQPAPQPRREPSPEPKPQPPVQPKAQPRPEAVEAPRPSSGLWPGAGEALNLIRGPRGGQRVCLTFDGGSNAEEATTILDSLKARGLHTTFFLTGDFIRKFPELVKRLVREGHEVGNHTRTHPHLAPNGKRDPAWTRARFQAELLDTDRAFQHLAGRPMDPLWRAPYGEHTAEIRAWAEEVGYRHIYWSEGADTLDWATPQQRKLYRTGEAILERLRDRMARKDGEGMIVLMHLGSERPEADRPSRRLGEFIDRARREGWTFVRIGDYLRDLGKPAWDPARRASLLAR